MFIGLLWESMQLALHLLAQGHRRQMIPSKVDRLTDK